MYYGMSLTNIFIRNFFVERPPIGSISATKIVALILPLRGSICKKISRKGISDTPPTVKVVVAMKLYPEIA